ncbi:uncharacterized protein [Henckelia pumila]|uniref:uncharacterized protein isoform X2 n=1 Tax=Henckelia pumila TaxID=405737 RepID=UPI003C6E8AB3
MAASNISSTAPFCFPLSSDLFGGGRQGPTSLSWTCSLPNIKIDSRRSFPASRNLSQGFVIEAAAWTRRSRSEAAKKPNRKSWKQRTDMYMRPFLLNVFFSKRFVHAKVMHRGTSKVISVATTNAKDLRNTLPSLTDNEACRVIGKLIADRSKEADVFAMSYDLKMNQRVEGRLAIVLDTIQANGNRNLVPQFRLPHSKVSQQFYLLVAGSVCRRKTYEPWSFESS